MSSVLAVNTSTDTFGTLINKLNQIIALNFVVGDTTGTGAVTTGNSYVNGCFTGVSLFCTTINGGNPTAPANLLSNSTIIIKPTNQIASSLGSNTTMLTLTSYDAVVNNYIDFYTYRSIDSSTGSASLASRMQLRNDTGTEAWVELNTPSSNNGITLGSNSTSLAVFSVANTNINTPLYTTIFTANSITTNTLSITTGTFNNVAVTTANIATANITVLNIPSLSTGVLTLSGNCNIGGTANVIGIAKFANTVAVTGATTFANTISVTGNATFSNTVTFNGNTNTGLINTGNVNTTGIITTTGNITTGNNLTVSANASINGSLGVTGSTFFTGNGSFSGNLIVGGALILSTGASILAGSGTLNINSNLFVDDTLTVAGVSTFSGSAVFDNEVKPQGIVTKAGYSGGFGSNHYNFYWTGSALHAYIDNTDLGAVTLTSDARVKQDIKPLELDAIQIVKSLNPVSFKYADIGIFKESKEHLGFLTQDLEKILPHAVHGEADLIDTDGNPIPQSINLVPIVAVLAKALEQAITKIESLEEKLNGRKV